MFSMSMAKGMPSMPAKKKEGARKVNKMISYTIPTIDMEPDKKSL